MLRTHFLRELYMRFYAIFQIADALFHISGVYLLFVIILFKKINIIYLKNKRKTEKKLAHTKEQGHKMDG